MEDNAYVCVYEIAEDAVHVCVFYCRIKSVLNHSATSSSDLFGFNPARPVLYPHYSSEIRYAPPLTNQFFDWQLGEEGVAVFVSHKSWAELTVKQ